MLFKTNSVISIWCKLMCMYSAIRPPNHHANTNCTIDIVKCQYKLEHLFVIFIEYDGGRATAPPPYMSMC